MATQHILIVGVGGLGSCMVREALNRGVIVSVLVRSREKLNKALGNDVLKLNKITLGDATDSSVLDNAFTGIDVVLSGRGADYKLADALCNAAQRKNIKKICWPAGTTNVLSDDGITPNYIKLLHLGEWVENAYRAHAECIKVIKNSKINYVIFCAGVMKSTGHRSNDIGHTVRINRDAGPFVSYEDAAWVMIEAATKDIYDKQLVSASTIN